MALIESGSLTPGVNPADFGLPPHTAIRWEMPDPALRPFLSDYHVLDSDGPYETGAHEAWMLPTWPAIRIVLAPRRMELHIGNRHYDPVHVASLYGTTTRAMRARAFGGVTIGVSIAPLGWSRLFRAPADRFRDRIVPLHEVLRAGVAEDLTARVRAIEDVTHTKAVLDCFFAAHLGPPSREEEIINTLARLIDDDDVRDLTSAAADVGIPANTLRRVSTRYFGFPPKTLLMRQRFLRTFLPMLYAGRIDYAAALERYHDTPHFLRDANRFLTMTPRRFLAIDQPYLYAAMRARVIVGVADRAATQRVGTGALPE